MDCSSIPVPSKLLVQRIHPRPRIPCGDCQQELVLRWGNERRPHLSHLPGARVACSGTGESARHRLAKKVLCEHLNGGGGIRVVNSCPLCGRKNSVERKVAAGREVAREEVLLSNNGRADVAIVSVADGSVSCVLEVVMSHKTDEVDRDGYTWDELDADDILGQWDNTANTGNPQAVWDLDQMRNNESCGCLSMKDIARKMGYLIWCRPDHENGCSLKFYTMLRRATINAPTVRWQWGTRCDDVYSYMWKTFLYLGKCLRCETRWGTSKGRPYCLECYKAVSAGDAHLEEELKVDIFEKMRLRSQFDWLNKVPIANQDPCVGCSLLSISPVFYFGKRSICHSCAEKAHNDVSYRNGLEKD